MKPFVDFAVGRRPKEELYDLSKDPHQIANVAASDSYAKVKSELRNRLMTVLRETGDPRITESPVRFENEPFTSPVNPRRRNNKAGNRK